MTTGGRDHPATGTPHGAGAAGAPGAVGEGAGSDGRPAATEDWAAGGPPMAPGQVPGAPVAPRDPAAPASQPAAGGPPTSGGPARSEPAPTEQFRRPAAAGATTATRPVTVGVAAQQRRGGRRARLTLKRIDPWSTLKFAFVYSLAGLVVLLVAVIALYAIVDAMGVIESIRNFLHDVEGESSGNGIASWLGFGRVMTVALVVGGVNVILFTAFATLSAFVYNVCTDLVGGIEVTLADRT